MEPYLYRLLELIVASYFRPFSMPAIAAPHIIMFLVALKVFVWAIPVGASLYLFCLFSNMYQKNFQSCIRGLYRLKQFPVRAFWGYRWFRADNQAERDVFGQLGHKL